jgi:hypothetical protein
MTIKTLTVRNIEQQALFLELDGQLSDGFWENAKPYDHYKPWCEAKVVVDPTNVGRNFWAQKKNYNFSAKALLDVVGLRMLATVRIARAFGYEVASILEFAASCNGKIYDQYNPAIFSKAAAVAGYDTEQFVTLLHLAVADNSYTMRDMRRDLNDLKTVVNSWAVAS